MKVQRVWVLWMLLVTTSVSAWAYPPSSYQIPTQGVDLGIRVVDLAFMELEQLNLECGVRVLDVAPRGPAANAGVLPGDIFLGLNGSPIYSVARLGWILRNVSPGDTVEMEVSRRGDRLTIVSRLSAPQGMPPRAARPDHAPPPTRTYLGVHLQEMTEDLQEAFGAPQGHGVLIAGVMADSPAELAGLKAGDLIVKLERKAVVGIDDVHRALAYFDPGEQVRVEIVRAAKPSAVTVTLRERPRDEVETELPSVWNQPEDWKKVLPPPEYWRRLIDGMMESLENDLSDLRRRWSEDGRTYY